MDLGLEKTMAPDLDGFRTTIFSGDTKHYKLEQNRIFFLLLN